jgi:hypothetical protein
MPASASSGTGPAGAPRGAATPRGSSRRPSSRTPRTIAAVAQPAALQSLLAEPASLTQVASHGAARCPVCSGRRLTRIALILTDGSPIDFTSCHTCEHKAWVHEGSALPIDRVLAKARKPR